MRAWDLDCTSDNVTVNLKRTQGLDMILSSVFAVWFP